MKTVSRILMLALACAPLSRAPAQSAPAADIPVMLSVADQQRMGVETAEVGTRTIADSVTALIRVLDPAPLAMLDADLAAAAAAANASDREFSRVSGLAREDQSASQQALEAAAAQAASDRAALSRLERRLSLEWGAGIATLGVDARGRLVTDLAAGGAALLRADAPDRPEGLVGRVLVDSEDDAVPIAAEPIGPAASVDPRLQTVGLICIVRGEAAGALRPGRVLGGRIETATEVTGVVLPRSALVRLDGSVWAYVRTGGESFARREVLEARPIDDGWFVTKGFTAGNEIVTGGAGSLIAVERGDEAAEQD